MEAEPVCPIDFPGKKMEAEPVCPPDFPGKKKPDAGAVCKKPCSGQANGNPCFWNVLNPLADLIYWRDPKKTGPVFGAILCVLLSLVFFSLISVLAYISFFVLTGNVLFRIYKTVFQAIQKTSDGHPFKDILEMDLTVPAEKVHEVADVAVAHANAAVNELRRLFLVEDFVDSLKFGVILWCLTYVGSWFNGLTLLILEVVSLFTLPKVYETNKAQIDQNLALVYGNINELTARVRAAIPLGKKEPVKEE
ncbi:reticulon isoform X4 [Megalopta genalis]|uniref:reticulon isoform X4 n=1 Tax=Megalopta genalis TaxID=115081 RepID=UPI0014432DF0|nr:reticulon-1-A isoform X4 [Megalopta genalis]